MDCSPPGSSVHRILQVRILEQVAIFYSGYLPDQGLNPRLLHLLNLWVDSFTTVLPQGLLVISKSLHLQSVPTIYSYILNKRFIEV